MEMNEELEKAVDIVLKKTIDEISGDSFKSQKQKISKIKEIMTILINDLTEEALLILLDKENEPYKTAKKGINVTKKILFKILKVRLKDMKRNAKNRKANL